MSSFITTNLKKLIEKRQNAAQLPPTSIEDVPEELSEACKAPPATPLGAQAVVYETNNVLALKALELTLLCKWLDDDLLDPRVCSPNSPLSPLPSFPILTPPPPASCNLYHCLQVLVPAVHKNPTPVTLQTTSSAGGHTKFPSLCFVTCSGRGSCAGNNKCLNV